MKVKVEDYEQKESANGKHLQRLIKDNNLEAINTREDVIKSTRQNRNKKEEKSVIDYIIVTPMVAQNTEEIIIDDIGTYRIKGRKESDHNTILMETKLRITKDNKKITRWRLTNQEGWKKYNKVLKEINKNDKPTTQDQLQNNMIKAMKRTIGQITISLNGTKSKESDKIKQLREGKKAAKKLYNEAIKTNKNRITALQQYITAQKTLRQEIEEAHKKSVKEKLEKMILEERNKRQVLWRLKAEVEKKQATGYIRYYNGE